MNKRFEPTTVEESIYNFWEKNNLLKAPSKGDPYTILMPPPNANASLHAGHGMYVIDDILIRYKRLMGFSSLWIPGVDHAGFETQYVYEKQLKKEGKSRLDFNRQTLYDNIYNFVQENSGLIFKQFKRLGFLADWDRSVFTLDAQVIDYVYETFKQMVEDGYVYRDEYIVNYCTYCGTSLADLEVVHVDRVDPLYYIKYGPFILATVRPETKFGDTALAVNPKDTRYTQWVGKTIEVEGLLGTLSLLVIADDFVDPEFGTGVVKVTPGHDPNDFQMGARHNLEIKKVIDLRGKLTELAGPYAGLSVQVAREKVAEDLEKKGLIDHIDEQYSHSVQTCYKCGRVLEPLTIPNWFIKVDTLKSHVKRVVKDNKVKFFPAKSKNQMLDWLDVMHDWPISRQIVWGIRIPVWYEVDPTAANIHVTWVNKDGVFMGQNNINRFLSEGHTFEEIEEGIQQVYAMPGPSGPTYIVSKEKPQNGKLYLQETDTFDTWFSSGQWPLVTLNEIELKSRFPTDFMGTLSDILRFWISRMILFSLYRKNEIPFKNVYLWSMVADKSGIKMSKSKGNVINPIDLIETYGADAFRASLVFGASLGGKIVLSDDKVRAMRNFANKLWNIGRLLKMYELNTLQVTSNKVQDSDKKTLHELNKEIIILKNKYIKDMDAFKFSKAFDSLYEFVWHRFADYYLEELKNPIREANNVVLIELKRAYDQCLLLLHPFVPFVTEALWQELHNTKKSILDESINKD